jgi:hypothetical protein
MLPRLASSGMLLAQAALGGWSVAQFAIAVVIIAAIIGLVLIGLRVMGVALPQWFWQVVGIVVIAAVIIFAIKIVASM